MVTFKERSQMWSLTSGEGGGEMERGDKDLWKKKKIEPIKVRTLKERDV